MKKILWAIAAIVVVLVVVVVAAPFLIPVETYKDEIRNQVRSATGRDLQVAGDINLSILPRTQLTVGKVSFSNPSWAEQPQMAELEQLQVRIDPFALLSGELQIESFVLEKPVIYLAVNKDGTPNWAFGTPGAAAKPDTGAAGAEPTVPSEGAGGLPLKDVGLRDVRLVDGTVTYTDMKTGESQTLSEVNLSVSLQALDQPFSADGSMQWNGETVEISLDAGAPRELMAGKPTKLALNVDSKPITLSYDGEITNAEPRKLEGGVELSIPSVKGLAAWTGNPIAAAEGTLEEFELAGDVSAQGQSYAFSAETLRLDDISGNGSLGLDLSGAKPYLNGRLDLAKLNLTPYLPEPTKPAGEKADGGAASGETSGGDGSSGGGDGAAAQTQWSDEPIDVSALHAADADFELSVEGIQAREVKVGKSALALHLKGGRLQADLNELNLYEGQGKGQVVVDARGDMPKLTKTMALSGVQAKPLLTDAAGFERLEGQGTLNIDISTQGRSQKAMVEALDGKGAIDFRDGAVVGINLAAMVRNVTSAFSEAGGNQKTDFAELSGTFTIDDGVLTNKDMVLLNPLLRVQGEGTANIPKRTVNYRLTPKAVASLEGQGSEMEKKGLAVPVVIQGPWHDLSYRPDLESLVKDAIKDPGKLKESAEETIESIKEGGDLKGVLEKLGGAGGESQEGEGTSDPGETLKKLFGD
ncbi:AsmA family protein [Ferruginivarius sediminum]|uniref:AsmA family protein n=1 Tax=Ferruginivarius sediminum TaxID=2661937 RepID=A0A369TFK8_9PROT|nr:AsmA family protein [Ferruginivarius sediminum]RDD63384.1 AsmA family protein [Ferruginivarius sediminum]